MSDAPASAAFEPHPAEPDYALLDRSGIGWMVLQPRTDPAPLPTGATDHRITVEPGITVAARFYQLGPQYPTVLFFHGNGEVVGDHDRFVHLYHASELNLFVAEFRGYGKSEGVPSMAHLVADAHPIAAYFHACLDAQRYDPRRFVMGRSIGALPALEIAAQAPAGFHGVVIESSGPLIRRLLDRFGYPDNADGWSLVETHEARIRSIRLPSLQLHGELDDPSMATELHTLLRGAASRQIELIDGAGHNDILWIGQVRYMELLRTFVETHSATPQLHH